MATLPARQFGRQQTSLDAIGYDYHLRRAESSYLSVTYETKRIINLMLQYCSNFVTVHRRGKMARDAEPREFLDFYAKRPQDSVSVIE
jgi:hypothetical protein